jgi:RHS repeat-associated protein
MRRTPTANRRQFAFFYDASGNITGDNRGATAGNFTHTINRAGRIATTLKGGVNQGAYTYDAFERLRIRVVANQTPTTNNGTTHYVWDIFGQIIAEANGSTGATLRETIYLDSMPLVAVDVAASPKKIYAVHVDHLNRPIMLTDAAKVNVWWASYEPFGKVRTTGGTLTQNLGLPGQWFQLESGLAHNWHRHYDPTTGRYTTADPLGFVDGPSVYAYAGNNPHRMVDPSGTAVPFILVPLAGAAGSALFNYGLQAGNNFFFKGRGFRASLVCVEIENIAASAALGAISPGWWFLWRNPGIPLYRELVGYQALNSAIAAGLGFIAPPIGNR